MTQSDLLFEQALKLMPGGVSSPVRAFKGVGGVPRFIERGQGAYLWDVDGNRYVDYMLSWGALILGHAHPRVVEALHAAISRGTSYGAPTRLENELAELLIHLIPSMEMIRFVNSGTEATMSALRLVRAATGREKIIKFAGCYHGHADMLLVQAGSGVATLGLPESPGVPAAATAHTLTAPYNNLEAVRQLFEQYPDSIAGVIVEPVAGNMGFLLPHEGFLEGLQSLCRQYGALFILDEVMTGFRVAMGGAQALWTLEPDLTCLGKVIGGGLPVGAYGGKRDLMLKVAPAGTMYQAGTLSGNPLVMTAGLTTLKTLMEDNLFDAAAARTAALADGLRTLAQKTRVPMQVGHLGTMFGFFFLKNEADMISDYASARQYADVERYGRFFHAMLEAGVYLAPSQFEAGFISTAHQPQDIELTLEAALKSLRS